MSELIAIFERTLVNGSTRIDFTRGKEEYEALKTDIERFDAEYNCGVSSIDSENTLFTSDVSSDPNFFISTRNGRIENPTATDYDQLQRLLASVAIRYD